MQIAAMMEYAVLGRSGLRISRIGLGCMSLSAPKEKAGAGVIQTALDHGVNFFDTADLYEKGANEELVGRALKGVREKIVLATKVGNQWRADGSGWDWNPTRAYIISSVEQSLKRLQTDYIDLYQLHGGTIADPMEETIDAFETLVAQGKILHYGISSIRPNVIRAFAEKSRITSVMLQYSLLDRRPEESVLSLLQEKGIGVLVRGALAQGLLINKPARPYLCHDEKTVLSARSYLGSEESGPGTATTKALRYVLQDPPISSIVAGASSVAQIQDSISVFDQTNSAFEMNGEREGLVSQAARSKGSWKGIPLLDQYFPACRYAEHR